MTDTILIVLSLIIFLVSFVLSRSPREARGIACTIWSAVAFVYLVGVAIVMVVQGQCRRAGGAVLVLLVFLTLTGFIPGLLLQWSEHRRARRIPRATSLPPSLEAEVVSESFPTVRTSSAQKKAKAEREVCPRCGQTLRKRSGRFGPFLGCSAYPRCRYTKAVA